MAEHQDGGYWWSYDGGKRYYFTTDGSKVARAAVPARFIPFAQERKVDWASKRLEDELKRAGVRKTKIEAKMEEMRRTLKELRAEEERLAEQLKKSKESFETKAEEEQAARPQRSSAEKKAPPARKKSTTKTKGPQPEPPRSKSQPETRPPPPQSQAPPPQTNRPQPTPTPQHSSKSGSASDSSQFTVPPHIPAFIFTVHCPTLLQQGIFDKRAWKAWLLKHHQDKTNTNNAEYDVLQRVIREGRQLDDWNMSWWKPAATTMD